MDTSLIKDLLSYLNSGKALAEVAPLIRISGGGNNQAYRFTWGGEDYFVKHYFSHPSDLRDRQGHELRFINLLRGHQILQVPEIITYDADSHLTVFKFIEGRRPDPSSVSSWHIDQLAKFFTTVNSLRAVEEARSIAIASESFFSISEHLNCVSERIERFMTIEGNDPQSTAAASFVSAELVPFWEKTKFDIEQNATEMQMRWSEVATDPRARCLSPSDFGFHNSLLTGNDSLTFVDFEYSGWDDPAKTICDLYWQVASPLQQHQVKYFYRAIRSQFATERQLDARITVLLPVFGVKWCCIVLNHFTKRDKLRKEFSSAEADSTTILDNQLAKAKDIFAKLRDGAYSSFI